MISVKIDYYHVLEVHRTASKEEIQKAFHRLVRQYHPDVRPDDQSADAKCREINEAYEVLSDPEKRRRYDQQRAARQNRPTVGAAGQGAAASGFPRQASNAEVPWMELFDTLFSSWQAGQRRSSSRPRGPDLEAELLLTPEEAYYGGPCRFAMPVPEFCVDCQGQGSRGSGKCGVCRGSGVVHRSRHFEINLPAGTFTGTVVRLEGQGPAAPGPGQPGDLYLRVRVRPCW